MDIRKQLAEAREAMQRGSLSQAERTCRSVLDAHPRQYHALLLLGDICARAGREAEALLAYEGATAAQPGASAPFTRIATTHFRKAFGLPVPARSGTARNGRRVQMRSLGTNGRFGNQLLQYGFVRLYAQRHDLVAEFPDWIGRDIFGFDDPLPSVRLPTINEDGADLFASLHGRGAETFAECDIKGYFCGNTSAWGTLRPEFVALFTPAAKIQAPLDRALETLRSAGKTIVAIHLRQGDFGYGRFWVASPAWYVAWLKRIWSALERPVLYIASDTSGPHPAFAEFDPWSADRLGVGISGIDFLVDHHILRHADHLAIANSTFSFTAAMLNERGASFLRPDPDLRALTPFDPWASEVLRDATADADAVAAPERLLVERRLTPGDIVAYWGSYCSPWIHYARSVQPNVMILEAEVHDSICRALRMRGIRHVRLLVLEDREVLGAFLRDSEKIFGQARVDTVLFRSDTEVGADGALDKLSALGYVNFRLSGDRLMRSPPEAKDPGSHLAVRQDLVPQFESRASRLCFHARSLVQRLFQPPSHRR